MTRSKLIPGGHDRLRPRLLLHAAVAVVATGGFLLAPVFHHVLVRFKIEDVE